MTTFRFTDPQTGIQIDVQGDKPPDKLILDEMFSRVRKEKSAETVKQAFHPRAEFLRTSPQSPSYARGLQVVPPSSDIRKNTREGIVDLLTGTDSSKMDTYEQAFNADPTKPETPVQRAIIEGMGGAAYGGLKGAAGLGRGIRQAWRGFEHGGAGSVFKPFVGRKNWIDESLTNYVTQAQRLEGLNNIGIEGRTIIRELGIKQQNAKNAIVQMMEEGKLKHDFLRPHDAMIYKAADDSIEESAELLIKQLEPIKTKIPSKEVEDRLRQRIIDLARSDALLREKMRTPAGKRWLEEQVRVAAGFYKDEKMYNPSGLLAARKRFDKTYVTAVMKRKQAEGKLIKPKERLWKEFRDELNTMVQEYAPDVEVARLLKKQRDLYDVKDLVARSAANLKLTPTQRVADEVIKHTPVLNSAFRRY